MAKIDFFEKNRKCITRLGEQLDVLEPYELIPTSGSKGYSAVVNGHYLESVYDPQAVAEAWAKHVIKEDGEGAAWLYILQGFGLGYHVIELLKRLPPLASLVVVEPDLRIIRTALGIHDFTQLGSSGQFVLITEATRTHVQTQLSLLGDRIIRQTKLLPVQRMLDYPEWQRAVQGYTIDCADSMRTGFVTSIMNSTVTCRNLLANLDGYVHAPSIDKFKDRYQKFPAICVSAGPSVDTCLPLLKAHPRDSYILICVPTMLKSLQAIGYEPDYVTTLDYHEKSAKFFQGMKTTYATLIAEPKVNGAVTKAWQGDIALLGNPWLDALLEPSSLRHDSLSAGSTVAHLSVSFAHYLGCDPIIMIGQDLAFTPDADGNPRYYPATVYAEHPWKAEGPDNCKPLCDPQQRPLRPVPSWGAPDVVSEVKKAWKEFVKAKEKGDDDCDECQYHLNTYEWGDFMSVKSKEIDFDILKVEEESKHWVWSDDQMISYLVQFEALWKSIDARIIDCSGGVKKENVEHMRFEDALAECATVPIIFSDVTTQLTIEPYGVPPNVVERLLSAAQGARAVGKCATDALAIEGDVLKTQLNYNDLKRKDNISDIQIEPIKKHLEELLEKMQAIHARVNTCTMLQLVEFWSGLATLVRTRHDTQLEMDKPEGDEKVTAQYARDMKYLAEMQRASVEFAETLEAKAAEMKGKDDGEN